MNWLNRKYPIIGFTLVFFLILTFSESSWIKSIENSLNDVQYILRGSRTVSDNIGIVYIGDDDLKALGEWPITRDYYSYIIHILNSSGAKAIGLDILFAHPDKRHPEFDQTLSDFLYGSGNVCLPMLFSELQETDSTFFTAINATWPFKKIRENSAGVGFSNYAKGSDNKLIPIVANYNDSIIYSFGYELARQYLTDKNLEIINDNLLLTDSSGQNKIELDKGRLLINHFGKIRNINSISLVDLFHQYKTNPDSLNFKDKLVLLTITASGITTLKETPLDESLPASLIHLTVAENLVNGNYFKKISPINQAIIILIFTFCIIFLNRIKKKKIFLVFAVLLLFFYWIASFISFAAFNTILPLLIPTLTIVLASGYLLLYEKVQSDRRETTIKQLLQDQIELKETQLEKVRAQLTQESASAAEQKKSILKIEKEINDLRIFSLPEQKNNDIKHRSSEIIFSEKSPMADVLNLVSKVSSDDIPVLIIGDTGTGKELIAHEIHQRSNRKDKPFVAINCGALPENLLESELFGHEKGSFTGALSLRKGRFEIAGEGTIFLDEITETSPNFQIKILRILQEGTFERLGGEQTLKTNTRIIAATNKNIQDEIKNNNFRPDLYYRLNGFPINLPTLKERPEDIAILSVHFLKKYNFEINLSDQAINILKSYPWPGNVRELENIIRRAAIMARSENRKLIQEKDLDNEIKNSGEPSFSHIYSSLDDQILSMLRSFKFSHSAISQTAKVLDNRDRGTVTEYFRGMCFEFLVNANFEINKAAEQLAQTDDDEIKKRVETKIATYLENLQKSHNSKETAFKGLPKKYHIFLEKIFKNLNL